MRREPGLLIFYNIDKNSLLQTKRGTLNWPRLDFMYISRKYFGHSLHAISEPLGCPYRSTVSAGIKKCHHRLLNQPNLLNELSAIHHLIKNSS